VQDLLDKIFQVQEKNRITVEQIKTHPWYVEELPAKYAQAVQSLEREQVALAKENDLARVRCAHLQTPRLFIAPNCHTTSKFARRVCMFWVLSDSKCRSESCPLLTLLLPLRAAVERGAGAEGGDQASCAVRVHVARRQHHQPAARGQGDLPHADAGQGAEGCGRTARGRAGVTEIAVAMASWLRQLRLPVPSFDPVGGWQVQRWLPCDGCSACVGHIGPDMYRHTIV
jgi:hypothetical protein